MSKGGSIFPTEEQSDSSETMKAKREWIKIFKVFREKIKTWNSVPCAIMQLTFESGGEIHFLKQKLREFVANRPALQEMFKQVSREKKIM